MSDAFANPIRGEVSLSLGERKFRLRPTFEALVRIEQEVGSLFAVVERTTSFQVTLKDVVTVLWSCAVAGGADVEMSEMGELIAENGISAATPAFRAILTSALAGPNSEKA